MSFDNNSSLDKTYVAIRPVGPNFELQININQCSDILALFLIGESSLNIIDKESVIH